MENRTEQELHHLEDSLQLGLTRLYKVLFWALGIVFTVFGVQATIFMKTQSTVTANMVKLQTQQVENSAQIAGVLKIIEFEVDKRNLTVDHVSLKVDTLRKDMEREVIFLQDEIKRRHRGEP